jgi:hypothetical protein
VIDSAKQVADKASEKAAAVADEAAKVGEQAAQTAADTAAAAGEAAGNAVEAATDAAGEAFTKLKEEATAWVDNVVATEWPSAKGTLDAAAAKVADIKIPAVKDQATKLVDSLKAQVPEMEGLVGKIKDAGAGDLAGLFDQAKTMFGDFTGKLGELKKLVGM